MHLCYPDANIGCAVRYESSVCCFFSVSFDFSIIFTGVLFYKINELLHYSDWWADPAKQNIPAAMHHFRNIGYFSLIPGMIDLGIIVELCIVRI